MNTAVFGFLPLGIMSVKMKVSFVPPKTVRLKV